MIILFSIWPGNSSLTRGGFGSAEPVCPCRQDWSSLKVFGTSKARLGTLRQQAGRAEDVRTAGAFGVSDPSPFTAGGLGPLVDTSPMSFLNDLYSRCGRRWPLLRKRGRARGRGPHLRICRAGLLAAPAVLSGVGLPKPTSLLESVLG